MRNCAVKKMGSCYISFAHKYLCILPFNSLLHKGQGEADTVFYAELFGRADENGGQPGSKARVKLEVVSEWI